MPPCPQVYSYADEGNNMYILFSVNDFSGLKCRIKSFNIIVEAVEYMEDCFFLKDEYYLIEYREIA